MLATTLDWSPIHRRPLRRRRRRPAQALAVVAALVALLLLFVTTVHGGLGGATPTQATVAPGDTLWSIAQAHTDGDVRAEVDAILDANHLSSPALVPGQVLLIPAG